MAPRAAPSSGPTAASRVVGIAVVLAVVALFVVWLIPWLLTRDPDLAASDRLKAMADVRTGLIALIAALGAAGGLSYTARTYRLGQIGQLTGRFQEASKQMGADNATMRLAGVQAMAQLADEWGEQRQRCIEVLCAYLRSPWDAATAERFVDVRRSVIRVVVERLPHLEPTTTSATRLRQIVGLSRPDVDWHGCTFDLTGATFDVGDFGAVEFADGRFLFDGASFDAEVRFEHARFTGASVSFAGASFGEKSRVSFRGCRFEGGDVRFDGARFRGETAFDGARFLTGCAVTFDAARLGDGGRVSFGETVLEGPGPSFAGAYFAEHDGSVSFARAELVGHVSFDRVKFRGPVAFDEIQVGHRSDGSSTPGFELSFVEARLEAKARLTFRDAECGTATFRLDGVESSGGCIDVSDVASPPGTVGAELGQSPIFCGPTNGESRSGTMT